MRYSKKQQEKVRNLNHRLLGQYGPQGWWPTTRETGKQPVYYPGREGQAVTDDAAFEIIVGSILTQNNTWSNAEKAIAALSSRNLLSIHHMAASDPADIAPQIIPARYYNQKSVRLVTIANNIADAGGINALRQKTTEELRKILLSWTGIGKETADSILCYAFSRSIFVVDAYTTRLFQKLALPCRSYETIQNLVHCAIKPSAAEYGDLHARIVKLYATGDAKDFAL